MQNKPFERGYNDGWMGQRPHCPDSYTNAQQDEYDRGYKVGIADGDRFAKRHGRSPRSVDPAKA